MNSTNALLFIHAQTSLHAGAGTALGTVDLPIQRERHTGWPTIAGSSLKGVVRDHCRPKAGHDELRDQWLTVFGPEAGEAELHAGAISLTDARILAFPVRSAKSVFAWVSCPEALGRLARDAKLVGGDVPPSVACEPAEGGAFTVPNSPLQIDESGQTRLLLEEYDFTVDHTSTSTGGAETAKIAEWLAERALADDFTCNRLKSHFVVLPDTEFTHFVRHATEVTARIGLDYETKTVSGGALFYEEFLPAETLLYSIVLANDSRRKLASRNGNGGQPGSVAMSAAEVLKFVTSRVSPQSILQIGGNETIGKGLCAVCLDLIEHAPSK